MFMRNSKNLLYSTHMKFLVLYQMPHSGLDEWMKIPEEERKAQEKQMEAQWNEWSAKHSDLLKETAGAGKPKRITKEGAVDSRNDIMMYSFVEADSLEAAAEAFKDNPHFGIPGAWIEVMPTKSM